jgi:hypothetical protein
MFKKMIGVASVGGCWLALGSAVVVSLVQDRAPQASLLTASSTQTNEVAATQEASAQEASAQKESAKDAAGETTAPDPEWIAKLEKYLTGATLKGRYTVLGKDIPPADEEYTIQSAKKLPEGDLWLIESRIKYGKWDVTVPITVPIKWADKTPVISIEKLTIPAMGTFSARVLFNNEMYSGTWAHDDVKGHLFGQVIPAKVENPEAAADRDPK